MRFEQWERESWAAFDKLEGQIRICDVPFPPAAVLAQVAADKDEYKKLVSL